MADRLGRQLATVTVAGSTQVSLNHAPPDRLAPRIGALRGRLHHGRDARHGVDPRDRDLVLFGAFDYLESRSAVNVSRQQSIEQSSAAMQVISEDLRAAYVYPTLASSFILGTDATHAVFFANVDTAKNVAVVRNRSPWPWSTAR